MKEIHGTDESSDEEASEHDEFISAYTRRDPKDFREFLSLGWVKNRLYDHPDEPRVKPPMFLIYYPVLLERGWGWERLVPYNSTYSIEWPEFKRYLKDYFSHNAGQVASLCAHHRSEPIGQGTPPAVCNVLHYAANLCLEIEGKLILRSHLKEKGVKLSCMIKKRAKRMIKSEGDSSAAAAAFVCTMMEAELMCTSLELEVELVSTKVVRFSNKIRLSALKIMLCKMNESDAAIAAGALVGIAKEARKICSLLREGGPNKWKKVDMSEDIRRCTAEVLTRLVEEFSCNRAGNADKNGIPTSEKTEKPIGVSTVRDVICEEPNSMGKNEHCLRDNNMRLNSDMRKLTRAQKKRFKREQKKLKRAEEWRLKNGNETKLDNYKGQGP